MTYSVDIEKIQLREEIANIAAKNGICKLKTNAIEQQIVAEKEIGEKIDEITPVKFTANNAIEKNGRDALENAKNELQAFYTSFNQNENYEGTFWKWHLLYLGKSEQNMFIVDNIITVNLAARQQLWQKLRDTFAHIPNVVLWTSIGEQMKQNMLAMETLSKMDVEKILYADCGDPSAKNSLQIEIGKLYAKHIKLCIMRHGVNKQSEAVTSEYVVFYESFLNDLRAKFQMYNNQTVDDDFLADYLAQYSALHYGKGEVQYLLKLIDENESEIQRRKRANDEYRNANTELSNLYGEMEKLYIRSHEDIYSLTHVREKIQHSEELTRYLLQCKKDQQMPAPGAELSRMNASVNSSLSSNNDSVLYRSDDLNSTTFSRFVLFFLFDRWYCVYSNFSLKSMNSFEIVDNTWHLNYSAINRSEVGMPRSNPVPTLPNQLNEIKTFLSIPIDKFKLRNPIQEYLLPPFWIDFFHFFNLLRDFILIFHFQTFGFVHEPIDQPKGVQSASKWGQNVGIWLYNYTGCVNQTIAISNQLVQSNQRHGSWIGCARWFSWR